MDTEKVISPEWLIFKGFILKEEDEKGNNWAWELDYPTNEGDLCYVEKKFDRQQFAVILIPLEFTNKEKYFDTTVMVRHNVGCGYVQIPDGFSEMTKYHFSLLYEAIRRKRL